MIKLGISFPLGFWFPLTNTIGVFVSIGHKLIYFGLIFQIRANKLMNIGKKSREYLRKIPHKEEVDPNMEVDGFDSPKTRSTLLFFSIEVPIAQRCGENDGLGPFYP